MNKNLKKIIAIALMLGTVSAVEPVSKINPLTKTVYAASEDNNIEKLSSLRVETQGGTGIKLYYDDSYKNYNEMNYDDIENDHIYYSETSANTIKLEPEGPDSKYIRVFNGTSPSTKGEDVNSDIKLSPGTNTITVRIYKEEPDKYVEYEDEGKVDSTYILNINCTPNSSLDESVINLKSLTVDGNKISLLNSQAVYTYNVSGNANSVSIEAKPEDDEYNEYEVSINGDDVDENDDYKQDVSLDDGENDIKIKVKDDSGDDREYILKINKGASAASAGTATGVSSASNTNTQAGSTANTTSTAAQNSTTTAAIKTNQWVKANNGWQYNDAAGNPMKNQWILDKNIGKWYYIGSDGFMKSNCWIESSGKYYYLNADGSMATDTIINGYKVGADGAWIS